MVPDKGDDTPFGFGSREWLGDMGDEPPEPDGDGNHYSDLHHYIAELAEIHAEANEYLNDPDTKNYLNDTDLEFGRGRRNGFQTAIRHFSTLLEIWRERDDRDGPTEGDTDG